MCVQQFKLIHMYCASLGNALASQRRQRAKIYIKSTCFSAGQTYIYPSQLSRSKADMFSCALFSQCTKQAKASALAQNVKTFKVPRTRSQLADQSQRLNASPTGLRRTLTYQSSVVIVFLDCHRSLASSNSL